VYKRCKEYCDVYLNGHPTERIANNLSFTFSGINASNLIALLEMQNVFVSAGSACNAGTPEPSRVLKAIGLSDEEAFSTIRVSITNETTVDDVDKFVNALVECIQNLQMFKD
jgi:cysteine desulfurase